MAGRSWWRTRGLDNPDSQHPALAMRTDANLPSSLLAYLQIRFLLPDLRDGSAAKLHLHLAHLVTVGRREQSVMADAHKGGRQDV